MVSRNRPGITSLLSPRPITAIISLQWLASHLRRRCDPKPTAQADQAMS